MRRQRRYYEWSPASVSTGIFHYFHGRCGIYYRFLGLGREWLMLIGFYSAFRQWHKFPPSEANQQPEPFGLQLALHQTVVMEYLDFHFYCTIKKSFSAFPFWVSKVHDHWFDSGLGNERTFLWIISFLWKESTFREAVYRKIEKTLDLYSTWIFLSQVQVKCN